MSNYVDSKYLHQLSSQLPLFKRKNDTLYNFRCPYCGDSKTNQSKARGYVFLKEGSYIFKCHNCGQGASIGNLIKHVDPQLHKEYVMERFKDKKREVVKPKTNTQFKFQKAPEYLKTPLKKLKKISQLKFDHPVKKYVNSRKIPTSRHHKLFYAPKFYAFVNLCVPNKFPVIKKDEPRLIIPFIDQDGKLLGFQGRAFGKSNLKYITIMLEKDAPKVYGIDYCDARKPVTIVEGPIDSMFLDNAVAMAGADLNGLEFITNRYSEYRFAYDNEPRSQEIVRRIEKHIDAGEEVVIFPSGIKEKDINDMVLAGRDPDEIQAIISNNTFSKLAAKAKLSEWRKV